MAGKIISAIALVTYCAIGAAIETRNGSCSGYRFVQINPRSQMVFMGFSPRIHPITCSSNVTSNLTMKFYLDQPSFYSPEVKVIDRDHAVAGVKVIRGKCNVTLEFEKYFMNECRIGTYECVATDATGKVIDRMKSVLHPMKISLRKKFDFRLEKNAAGRSRFFVGAHVNLTCTYRSRDWMIANFGSRPQIIFHKLDKNGRATAIHGPGKFTYTDVALTEHFDGSFEGTRKIIAKGLTADDSDIYYCSAWIATGNCAIMQRLNISVDPCKVGHYCNSETYKELPCPLNTWSNRTNATNVMDCIPCPIGTETNKEGSWIESECRPVLNKMTITDASKGSSITVILIALTVGILVLWIILGMIFVIRKRQQQDITASYSHAS